MYITGQNRIYVMPHDNGTLAVTKHLEALPVDNGWAALIILLFGDPHLLEGRKGRQDGTTNPDRVFPLRGSNDLDLDG